MSNHTSYELSKALKEFLGDSAPEPMENAYYVSDGSIWENLSKELITEKAVCPAYTLEDILSKPFCEAIIDSISDYDWCDKVQRGVHQSNLGIDFAIKYYDGGFPAVELALKRLIG